MNAIISLFGLTTPPEGMEWMLYLVKAFFAAFFTVFVANWFVALTKQIIMRKW